MKIFKLLSLLFVVASIASCKKDYAELNQTEIQEYIMNNNLTTTETASGLHYVITSEGTGVNPTKRDNVTVRYTGYYTDGTIFDGTQGTSTTQFNLQQVIAGWTEGIQYIKEGGSATLIIPSALAYGDKGNGSVPGGSVLVFDVELVCINNCTLDFSVANQNTIEDYLTDNNLTATKTDSGLHYIITNEGTGGNPTANADVEVTYKGYYTDGDVFDETTDDETATFNLQQVIQGWTEGITYMKKGGSATLLIPSYLGYGESDFNGIPAGSVLIFDVELIEFVN